MFEKMEKLPSQIKEVINIMTMNVQNMLLEFAALSS